MGQRKRAVRLKLESAGAKKEKRWSENICLEIVWNTSCYLLRATGEQCRTKLCTRVSASMSCLAIFEFKVLIDKAAVSYFTSSLISCKPTDHFAQQTRNYLGHLREVNNKLHLKNQQFQEQRKQNEEAATGKNNAGCRLGGQRSKAQQEEG